MKTRLAERWTAAGATAARRLFIDRQAAFWRRELRDPRAEVVEIIAETADTKTFVLQPRAGWRGHRAGQHTTIEVDVDGVRLRRCYTISSAPGGSRSSAPGGSRIAITVKRQSGGRVSGWLHDHLRVGDRVALAPAAGAFVLPSPRPDKLLFLSGGSGITPVMAMLRQLARQGAVDDVVFVHHARRRDDVIFGAELAELAAAHPGLRLVLGFDDDPQGRFDEERLARQVPDFAARATFLCGPAGLMARVERMWEAAGASARLERERFARVGTVHALPTATSQPLAPVTTANGEARVAVRLARSDRSVAVDPSRPLLDGLEAAGVRPPYGCRIGVCRTCQCKKRSGVVENLLTGVVSSADEEEIQLCISAPRGDVELSL